MAELTRKGCLKRFAVFFAILVSIIVISSVFIYERFNGKKGVERWVVSKTLESTEKLALKQRPDGISKSQIQETFKQVKNANKNDNVNLNKLYQILKKYQKDFQNEYPSNQEMAKFLEELQSTIIKE